MLLTGHFDFEGRYYRADRPTDGDSVYSGFPDGGDGHATNSDAVRSGIFAVVDEQAIVAVAEMGSKTRVKGYEFLSGRWSARSMISGRH